ncbi:hypothetical protein [Bdellovibrio sp. NC01]|uniref:hypothetical protein n=1 Tax=Bdellovibrio sp. NC01 TaxID=2220073 RepID=UPI0011576BBB|nr:hypothetical protein [Bdellovibrio sp. NC01]QDK39182.1 hypothetical protein DOE51_17095 [Bdellovibrio sp. NC01]
MNEEFQQQFKQNLSTVMEAMPIDLSFSVWAIVAGILFSTVGWYLYRHGKKNVNPRNVYSGLALMIYPYFVSGALYTWVIGLLICGYVFYWWD